MEIKRVKTGYLEKNFYVVSINDDCLIIDPGNDFDKIKKLVNKRSVLGVLITHYHFDHIGALNDVKNYYNCPVIDYKSEKIQNIGLFTFEIIKTTGHKEDSVIYYFKDKKVMFVGGFIFEKTIGRWDLDDGNFKDMKESLNKIKMYDSSIILYPVHEGIG